MSKLDNILNMLGNVRKGHDGTYMCRCPAHKDKAPSLGVKEDHDGKILINCLAGCTKQEILDALGLSWEDLFPDKDYKRDPERPSINIREIAQRLSIESSILYQYVKDMERGEEVNVDGLLKCMSAISVLNTRLEGRKK